MEGLQYGIQQGYNPMAAGAYTPQALLNSLPGGPLAGLIGSGIAGLLTQNAGRQSGQFGDGFAGALTPYGVDPTIAYLQQIQLAQQQAQLAQQGQFAPQGQFVPQGWLGHHAGPVGQMFHGANGGGLGNPYIGNPYIGNQNPYVGNPYVGNQYASGPFGLFANQPGRFSPLGIDPVTAAYAQQRAQLAQLLAQQLHLDPQGQFGQSQFGQGLYGNVPVPTAAGIANQWANPQLNSPIGSFAGLGARMQPSYTGPMGPASGYGGFPAY